VLHFVASKNNLDVARKLLEQVKPPASARVRDKRGQYPLHRAAAVGSVPMVNLLVKHRSPLNATDSAGYTALHHAVAEGHGKTPFSPCHRPHLCRGFGTSKSKLTDNIACDIGDTAVALLKAGVDTDKKDSDGCLALDLAPDRDVCYPFFCFMIFADTLLQSRFESLSNARQKRRGLIFQRHESKW
jgi:26S proteasome non-ATPase regulatory subunit 10